MPDNLTVEISANSGKLRADLTLLQKQLRDVRKDLTAAATAGDTSKVNELSLSYEKLSAQIRGTSRALSAQNRVVAESNTSYGRLASIVGDAGNALGSLIGMSGGLKTFFSVFTVVEGVRKAFDLAGQSMKDFRQVASTAAGTGFDPEFVKAFNMAMTNAGLAGEKSAGALAQFSGAAYDALAKWKETNKELLASQGNFKMVGDAVNTAAQNMSIARGGLGKVSDGLVKVTRGAEKLEENRDVFASIGVDISKFVDATGRLNLNKLAEATGKALEIKRQLQPAAAGRGGSLLFGEDDITRLSTAINDLTGNLQKYLDAAKKLPPTPQDLANQKAYDQAIGAVNLKLKEFRDNATASGLSLDTDMAKGILKALTGFDALGKKANETADTIRVSLTSAWADVTKAYTDFVAAEQSGNETRKTMWTDLGTWIVDSWTSTTNKLYELLRSFFSWLYEKANAAASALTSLGAASGAPGGNLEGYASGGMVRGRGGIDNIWARLTNGEFVMRPAAVQHWGPQLLASMNALRGPVPGFAEGGLVGAAAGAPGTPVTLVLDGQRFSMMSDNAVAESLLRVARKRNMLSAMRV
jgi:hypothetical protein